MAFGPQGRYLAMGGSGRDLHVTEVRNRRIVWEKGEKDLRFPVRSVAFSADEHYLAVGSEDGTARLFEVQSGNEVRQWTHRGAVGAVAFSRDGRYLATGSDDGAAHVFDVVDGREVLRQPHKHAVASVAFSADQRLASGSTDGSVGSNQGGIS